MGFLDYAGLQYLWDKLKEKFAPKSHNHDDRYYTESEMDGKLNSKVDNNEAGANGLLSKLTTSWTATPTDNTYFIRQDTGGGNSFGRVKFSTLWNYIKGKADSVYQPKGSYAASGHTHDDRYYTESEMNTKLAGKSDTNHGHPTSKIVLDNSTNYAGYAGPIEAAHIDVLRANRLAFLPASGIKIEYSIDGGATWIDYGATDYQKVSLFAMRMGSGSVFYAGKHTKKEECTTKDQLRITVTPVDRYASVNMLYLWVSVAGTSATVNISRSTIGAKEIFTDVRTDVPISGWSGPNEVRFSQGTFGGGSTQTGNQYSYRFTFKNKADGKGSVSVMDIRMYGPSAWSVANPMMEKDHIYRWDTNQNVSFPAQVTATKFNGSATSVVDYGDTAGETIKIGYNGTGLTKDKVTHIAGYAKDGNQTVIKDVDRGVLQSWLNLNEMINTQLTTGSSTPSDNDFYIAQYAGGGSTTTTYHRRPVSALWAYIKDKTDAIYAAKSHSHTKAQITDFPSSLKNPTTLTIQTNGTTAATYDGSAAKAVNITKGNIGLGNVDNTADADKSVKYANSAVKLDSSAGSNTQPVYFSGGKPVVIGYTIAKSVPADAKFTDTNTWRGVQNNLTSDSTDQSLSAAQGKALKGLVDGKADKSHTHNYAGSDSAGGAANSANILNSRGTVAPQTGRTQNYGDVYAYKTTSGDSSKGAPVTHTATIGFGKGSSGTVEICGEWTGGKGLWSRALRDCQDSWYDWQRIYTENYHPNADYASSAGAVAWDKVSGKPSTYPPSSHSHAYIPSAGGDVTNYLNFNQTSTGIAWSCANGDIYHLRTYSPNNVFQLTRQNPDSKIDEYGVLNITGDGDIFFGRPGSADAFPMLGTVATGSNYIRFGDGTQICWGAITYNYQSASEISFPVPFVNTSYAVSGFLSIHSGVEKVIRFGNKSTSSFRITIQNGVSSQLDWMAIGRWC